LAYTASPVPFSIYRSSAGSGKTRTLAREYLALCLRHRHHYFRHILAVTFTNKATQEMKDRILRYLHAFAEGRDVDDLGAELRERLGLDAATFRQNANEVRSSILHDYSHFSISTIDAFFQRVIRAFTREADVLGDYRLEVDLDLVLGEVVDELMDELGDNPQLTRWVVDFARENLEHDQGWDIRASLVRFSKEIFKEEFYAVEDEVLKRNSEPAKVLALQAALRTMRNEALEFLNSRGNYAVSKLRELGAGYADIKWGSKGSVLGRFEKYAGLRKIDEADSTNRETKEFLDPGNWPSSTTKLAGAIKGLASKELIPLLKDINRFKRERMPLLRAAKLVLDNFYAYGLIADIVRKLADYKAEHNMLLLADAPRFLNRIIAGSDTPFIYEKVGSFYRHFLIDEFQDTSGMQWSNLSPLLINTLDEGNASLVVGDVKQSIYRWRGGDLRLLQHKVEEQVGAHRREVVQLAKNFRSAREIVEFNNIFFKEAALRITRETGGTLPADAYADVQQEAAYPEKHGLVQIRFLDEADDDSMSDPPAIACRTIEDLQAQGVPLKSIAILVRANEEGRRMANHLIAYGASDKAKPGCRYEVISNESLRLDGASSVKLLLACLRYLVQPADDVARARLAHEYHTQSGKAADLHDIFDATRAVNFESLLPPEFTGRKAYLRKLPLYELVETLVSIFKLNDRAGELSYLLAFQDLVLQFFTRERNDIETFLAWWEEAEDEKRSIKVPEEVDAIRILTIHKAKGLEFGHVIIPFCSWSRGQDYGTTLWVTSEEDVFADAGPVPVRLSKAMENTVFADAYEEETVRAHLDSLNLLYVAFTRAMEGLYVISNRKYIGELLYKTIFETPALFQHYDRQASVYRFGTLPSARSAGEGKAHRILDQYPVHDWRERIVVRKSYGGYFDGEAASRDQQRYGVHVHTILSSIRTSADVPAALSLALASGSVPGNDMEAVKGLLQQVLSIPAVAKWFEPGVTALTEIPILMPGGSEYRLDRLVIDGRKAVVIDYKSGERQAADRAQVETYKEVLGRMGYSPVEGYLLYLREAAVVSVETPPVRSARGKRPGPDQLELEL
jgi:ATP-dependent exoDNAse (exonuclease V) beta subunit